MTKQYCSTPCTNKKCKRRINDIILTTADLWKLFEGLRVFSFAEICEEFEYGLTEEDTLGM
jgi:hypothetical protein